jgi:hypothetical protein
MTWPDDCTVRLIDMPVSVGGRISECPDGHIDIYINARHSEAGRRRDLEHELEHWQNDVLHNDLGIRAVEGRHARQLPPLIRASDLLDSLPLQGKVAPAKPVTEEVAAHPPALSPYQLRVLATAMSELDRFLFSDCAIYDY